MINFNELVFHESSLVDSFGSVFVFSNNIYRAINKGEENFCRQLLSSQLFKELLNRRFIPETKISNINFENYNLVLEHERFVDSKPCEWSFSMLKDAALLTLRINSICNKFGYELKDAHPYNVLFEGAQPRFVDIGSIVPIKGEAANWRAFKEFVETFYIPLFLWHQGELYFSRLILESNFYEARIIPNQPVMELEYFKRLKKKITFLKIKLPLMEKEIKLPAGLECATRMIIKTINASYKIFRRRKSDIIKIKQEYSPITRKNVEVLQKKIFKSGWMNYHNVNLTSGVVVPPRFYRLIEIIKKKCNGIESALDLAANKGLFSILLNKNFKLKHNIASDYDENAVDAAYCFLKENSISDINVLLLNFMLPIDLEDTAKRLKSDLVVALAVTHHLILNQKFSIGAILNRIRKYTNKYVMIEFMPLGLWSGKDEDVGEIPEWYSVNWFRENFKNYFVLLEEEVLEKNRVVFLGELKHNRA